MSGVIFRCTKRSGGDSSQWLLVELLGFIVERRFVCKVGLGASSKVCAE